MPYKQAIRGLMTIKSYLEPILGMSHGQGCDPEMWTATPRERGQPCLHANFLLFKKNHTKSTVQRKWNWKQNHRRLRAHLTINYIFFSIYYEKSIGKELQTLPVFAHGAISLFTFGLSDKMAAFCLLSSLRELSLAGIPTRSHTQNMPIFGHFIHKSSLQIHARRLRAYPSCSITFRERKKVRSFTPNFSSLKFFSRDFVEYIY